MKRSIMLTSRRRSTTRKSRIVLTAAVLASLVTWTAMPAGAQVTGGTGTGAGAGGRGTGTGAATGGDSTAAGRQGGAGGRQGGGGRSGGPPPIPRGVLGNVPMTAADSAVKTIVDRLDF